MDQARERYPACSLWYGKMKDTIIAFEKHLYNTIHEMENNCGNNMINTLLQFTNCTQTPIVGSSTNKYLSHSESKVQPKQAFLIIELSHSVQCQLP